MLPAALTLAAACSIAAVEPPPNIVLILADDLAMGDVGCYGQKLIKTPNLDRLAQAGTRFTQAYCGTSVCAPSRAVLLTGVSSPRNWIRANRATKPEGQMPLPAEVVTIGEVAQSAGYATACMGKWGLGMFNTPGSPLKQGFARFFGYNCQSQAHSYFPDYLYDDDRRIDQAKGTYSPKPILEAALTFVQQNAKRPFLLYYAPTLPHSKLEIDDLGAYATEKWSKDQQTYAAMVTRLDTEVGALVDAVERIGATKRTLVLFTADNGSAFAPESPIGKHFKQGATGLRGFKRSLYEGALRNATIASWPGTVPAGRVADEPWAFQDVLPTIAELVGKPVPQDVDGLSVLAHLKGGKAPAREAFCWELHEKGPVLQAVRFGDWKAVNTGKAWELYDLGKDPNESRDLAAAQPALVEQAKALLASHRRDNPAWPLARK